MAASVPTALQSLWLEGASVIDPFRDAVTRLTPDVWRVLRRCGVADADVDDAQQLVFIQMHKKWDKLAELEPRALRAYVLCVASGTARELGRGRSRRFRQEDALEREPTPAVDTPHDSLALKERCAIVDRILSSMDDERREVFVLYELQELSGREIAANLGIPPGTVASRLRAAREHFERKAAELSK
jgi:RNA polymerase sigma-70 factor (ECF subfamily)